MGIFNRLFGVLIVVGLLATGTWAYYLHSLLLSPEHISSIIGPQEGYYWTAAQYQIAYLRMENQLGRYTTSPVKDYEALAFRYDILLSKYSILSQPSDLTIFFESVPQYREASTPLNAFMKRVGGHMAEIRKDPRAAVLLLKDFVANRDFVNTLANSVRTVEMQRRDEAFIDFIEKRRIIFTSSVLLVFLFLSVITLLLFNGHRRKQLVRQQQAAIEAEQTAKENAEKAAKAKTVFLGMISHELRTPLQTIITSLDLMVDREHNERRDNKVIKRLANAAQQLEKQMKDLTDYARLDAGRLEIHLTVFSPKDLILAVIENYLREAERKGLVLSFEESGLGEDVTSDPYRLQQIVGNLLANAIKYSASGVIRILLSRPPETQDRLFIAVEDKGPGISEENLKILFQPFTQLDPSSTRRYEGAGMGLAIVHGLVGLLGGTIHVDSKVGRGTRFEVTLPVGRTEYGVPTETNEAGGTPTPAWRVLVVDDRSDIRDSFKDMLNKIGYTCDTSSEASDAIKQLSSVQYDALLLDIYMPGKDGFEVAAEIRKREGPNQTIPIIGVSAYAAATVEPERLKIFNEYLMKPVHYEVLRTTLANLIKK